MSLTLILIILTGISSYAAFRDPVMRYRSLFLPAQMHQNGEWYRFLTHGFVHSDWIHAGVNLYVLWMFGEVVESQFRLRLGAAGPLLFVALYLGGLLASSLPVYAKRRNDPGYSALGASGAVSAVVFSYIVFFPLNKIYLYFVLGMPAALMGVIYLVYSSYMDRRGGDNIAHDAHFYGALFGLLFTLAVEPQLARSFVEQIAYALGAR
jgi:membrane associated rhomboid family serine protease